MTIAACGGRTNLGDDEPILDGSVVVDASITPDGGVIQDGGIVVFDVAPPPDDALPPPPPPDGGPITCGKVSCNSATEVCCVTFGNQQVTYACTQQGQCQGASLDCTSAASCPSNEVCCGNLSQQNIGSQCEPQCAGGFQNPQLCATSAECPKGTTCKSSQIGFKICRP